MSLRINTNVAALNSYNNLNANQAKLEGAFQQLSSGLRINKAADDAAGLSIAQGLTSQINGLTQAVSNANDGINVAQIADGALGTTQDILQRMRGLVVKAANVGTQDSDSLGAIQKEIKNLNTQLDNIAKQTKFGQTNLLDGSYNKNFQVGANGNDTITLNLSAAGTFSTNIGGATAGGTDGVNLTKLAIASNGGAATSIEGFTLNSAAGITAANGNAQLKGMLGVATATTLAITTDATKGPGNWIVSVGADKIGTVSQGEDGLYTVTRTTGAQPEEVGKIDGTTYDATAADYAALTTSASATAAGVNLIAALTAAGMTAPTTVTYTAASGGNPAGWSVLNAGSTQVGSITVADGIYTFHDGTAGIGTGKTIGAMNSTTDTPVPPGVTYTSDNATADLNALNDAINNISNARSQIGAVQNQLGYTVSNLQTAITNVTASRSNLTDADLAQQVTAMTQSQILTQAATSVLAQANSAPQAILKLLQ